MLIEFAVENFLSIRDEMRLSMVAGSGKDLFDTNVIQPKVPEGIRIPNLLRSAALYGQNAGGKSNIFKALQAMERMVLTSNKNQDDDLPVTPFKFSAETRTAPSSFEVIILVDGVQYQYGFSATSERIHEEWLFAYPKGRPQRWFERYFRPESDEYIYQFSDKLTGQKRIWEEMTRPNALFLSIAIQLNSEDLKPVYDWFRQTLHITGIGGWSPGFSIEWCQDEARKERVLQFLQEADFAISDIRIDERDFQSGFLPSNMPNGLRRILENELQGKKAVDIKIIHPSDTGEPVELDLDEESDGTQKMFALAAPWLDSLEKGHVLFIDELHDTLHPLLVRFLVQLFHNRQHTEKHAQLIFSTHETSLMNQKILRRDQVWYCKRDKEQSTHLYSQSDFKIRKDVDLARGYLSGRYGSVPFIAPDVPDA